MQKNKTIEKKLQYRKNKKNPKKTEFMKKKKMNRNIDEQKSDRLILTACQPLWSYFMPKG